MSRFRSKHSPWPVVAAAFLVVAVAAAVAADASTVVPTAGPSVANGPSADAVALRLDESQKLLDAGQAAEALVQAEEGLEFAPDHLALLHLAARSAAAAEKKDHAIWYAAMALGQTDELDEKARLKKVEELEALIAAADPLQQKNRAVEDEYAQALLKIGADLSRRQMYVSAVGILARLRGTSVSARADAELARVYDNKKAVAALLDSGLDVPLKPRKKRDPAREAKEDEKHSTWDKRWEIKGECYTVRTTLSREIAEQISLAMEQMNRFYRKVFGVKEHGGGNTARVILCVYKDRAEFDAHEKDVESDVVGFFRPGANYVATYDRRPEGGQMAELWSTLFHEASHQFTHMVSADVIPGWLNEGTASYFEGARLLPNGTVETNRVAEERLEALKYYFDEGQPELEQVLRYHQAGSYDGEFYPFGWGLVYFIHNYENEKSQRVYLPVYRDYLLSYKSGEKHDAFQRFVEYFVTKAKQPGIATFEDFEKHWKAWIQDLHRLHNAGAEATDELIARARKQMAHKQVDAAIESYTWALSKRPNHPVAWLERADVHLSRKANDAAFHDLRRAQECLRAVPDLEQPLNGAEKQTAKDLMGVCAQKLLKLDRTNCEALTAADLKFQVACLETAEAYVAAEAPLVALQLLEDARGLIGAIPKFEALREQITADTGADTRRWRRIVNDSIEEYDATEHWHASEGRLTVKTKELRFAYWKGEVPSRYRFEVRVDASKVEGAAGLLFGGNSESVQLLVALPELGMTFTAELAEEIEVPDEGAVGPFDPKKSNDLMLAIEVLDGLVEFFVDDQWVKTLPYEPDQLEGVIGVFVDGGEAVFQQMRLRW